MLLASGAAVPISQLRVGEKVLATDTRTGKTQAETVVAVLVHHDSDLYDLKIRAGTRTSVIDTTSNHLFYVPGTGTGGHGGRWVKAGALKYGTHLRTPDGGDTATVAGGWIPKQRDGWMWDLTIPGNNDHDFYIDTIVGDVLVHNVTCPTAGSARFATDSNGVTTDLEADMSRAGKAFTAAGKRQVIAESMENNGGVTVCDDCGAETIPAAQSTSGVSPDPAETRIDHIWPRSQGGPGSPWNGRVTCVVCNGIWSDTPKGPL